MWEPGAFVYSNPPVRETDATSTAPEVTNGPSLPLPSESLAIKAPIYNPPSNRCSIPLPKGNSALGWSGHRAKP